ncbi:MAG: IPT/TIG domain-containing protein [Pirellulales bacterium]
MSAAPSAGNLTASVSVGGVSSGAAVQVAKVLPTVTSSNANLDANAATITINGTGFSTTAGNNTVVFNNGAVGTVTSATSTALTVTFSTKPTSAGSLTAIVTTNSVASAAAVQVATVKPVVTQSLTNLARSANTITINGFGFSPTAANNTVVFNNSATGTVTAATATSLTITFGTKPVNAGSLTAIITSNTVGSGSAVQVATMT